MKPAVQFFFLLAANSFNLILIQSICGIEMNPDLIKRQKEEIELGFMKSN